mmetsp:Transcript_10135/g.25092  ORF Transcript_10135/g.25092 Transcript_10135/m.25092 type:complete len:292 (-) Transcript_10135:303-1178(-)
MSAVAMASCPVSSASSRRASRMNRCRAEPRGNDRPPSGSSRARCGDLAGGAARETKMTSMLPNRASAMAAEPVGLIGCSRHRASSLTRTSTAALLSGCERGGPRPTQHSMSEVTRAPICCSPRQGGNSVGPDSRQQSSSAALAEVSASAGSSESSAGTSSSIGRSDETGVGPLPPSLSSTDASLMQTVVRSCSMESDPRWARSLGISLGHASGDAFDPSSAVTSARKASGRALKQASTTLEKYPTRMGGSGAGWSSSVNKETMCSPSFAIIALCIASTSEQSTSLATYGYL